MKLGNRPLHATSINKKTLHKECKRSEGLEDLERNCDLLMRFYMLEVFVVMTIEATRNKRCTKNRIQWSIHRTNGASLLIFVRKTCTGHFLLNQFSLRNYSLLNTY